MDRVLIMWTPDRRKKDRDLIAFLPDVPARPGMIMSFMHIGQHGEASKAFMYDCKPATRAESEPFRQELIEIGYELDA
jgi:hypothetical protein